MSSLLNPINPSRLRSLPKSYSWVDHCLVHEGHLKKLSSEAAMMYLFLVTVGDRSGISYYSDRSVSERINLKSVSAAGQELVDADLIAYARPLYQVLSLPKSFTVSAVIKTPEKSDEPPASEKEISAIINAFRGGGL